MENPIPYEPIIAKVGYTNPDGKKSFLIERTFFSIWDENYNLECKKIYPDAKVISWQYIYQQESLGRPYFNLKVKRENALSEFYQLDLFIKTINDDFNENNFPEFFRILHQLEK